MLLPDKGAERLLQGLFLCADNPQLRGIATFLDVRQDDADIHFSIPRGWPTKTTRESEGAIKQHLQGLQMPHTISAIEKIKWLGFIEKDSGKPRKFSTTQDALLEAIKQVKNPVLQQLCNKLCLAGEIQEIGRNRGNYYATTWAMGLTQNPDLAGTYFATEMLRNITDPNHLFHDTSYGSTYRKQLIQWFQANPKLLDETISTIKDLGFNRFSFLNAGASSIVFCGVKDEKGDGQLVAITPSKDNYIPNPLMLPAIESRTVSSGNKSIIVRIMPELNTEEVTDEHIRLIKDLVKRSGLYNADIARRNIGLFSYVDESGTKKELPFILDWGAVMWPDIKRGGISQTTPYISQQFIDNWAEMPELAPWREAQKHFATKVQNVLTGDEIKKLYRTTTGNDEYVPSEDKGLIACSLDRLGLYPQEFGALSFAAVEATKNSTEERDYHSLLRYLVRMHDRSLSPDINSGR